MIAPKLLKWYERHQRKLPWRDKSPHPYHVLLSEAMLQQTQVATVIPYFNRFIMKFPALEDLASADEQEVLRLWQGLGYYTRARNLHRAAKEILRLGRFPTTAQELLELPGIGPYTAGAIASIAFHQRAPIVDGNVQRVLCRLDAITRDPRDKKVSTQLWQRAEEILPQKRCGEFNSALMELGATVCTPRNPKCDICPLQKLCQAFRKNLVDEIPVKKKSKSVALEKRITLCIQHRNKFLIEQRPSNGRWASLWQFITRPAEALPKIEGKYLGKVTHALTHRRYEFDVYLLNRAHGLPSQGSLARWVRITDLPQFPMSVPQVKIARLLDIAHLES